MIDVTGFGGTVKQYQVLLDTQLMRRYDVTLQMVTDAIAKSNANVGGDILSLGAQSHNVRAIGLIGEAVDSLDPARGRPRLLDRGREARGHPGRRRDLVQRHAGLHPADRQGGHRLPARGWGSWAATARTTSSQGIVLMRKYEKSLPTSEAVQEKIDELNRGGLLPKGMKIVPFNRRTDLVHVTTHNVIHNLVVGMVLVIVILFIFLGDLTCAGIVALMIPLALLVLGDGAVPAGEVGQPAVDRRGRLRDHRRQLGDHRRERLPPHHGARTPTGRGR